MVGRTWKIHDGLDFCPSAYRRMSDEPSSIVRFPELQQDFFEYPNGPLVNELPAGGGRSVKTYFHLLGGETGLGTSPPQSQPSETIEPDWQSETDKQFTTLESSLAQALAEIAKLKTGLSPQ